MERRQCKTALGIAQYVHALPCTPLHKGIVDIAHLLFCRDVLGVLHISIALYRHLATWKKIAVLAHQRVERHDVLRLLHTSLVSGSARLLYKLKRCKQCTLSLAVRGIVVVHCAVVVGTHTYNVQHIIIVVLRVDTVHNKRLIPRCIGIGKRVRMRHRLGVILFANSHSVVKQASIVGIHRAKHRLIHSSKHMVATAHRSLFGYLKTLYCRQERVGRHHRLATGYRHLCLKQLTVFTLSLCLVGYLCKHLKCCLWMILLHGRIELLPKGCIRVGYGSQWH